MEPATGADGRPGQAGPPPAAARELAGERLSLLERYVGHLATTGAAHGLIGPREVDRLWERHVLNCAAVAAAFAPGEHVVDVGSGAGLPGLVLAVVRPDLRFELVEPLERRTTWLDGVVTDLGLTNVTVRRARAEALWGMVGADAATSRAVASLGEIARLSLPLVRPGGRMVALKGERAGDELDADAAVLARLGVARSEVLIFGDGVIDPPTTVVTCHLGDRPAARVTSPVGDGPARTAERKKARAKERRRRRRESPDRPT